MSIQTRPREDLQEKKKREVVNDFSIQVATVNGSGSQSSNNVLMRAIFQMGVPISGKNLFPSNIAGLPTWFTIRASKKGYVGCKKEIDVLTQMGVKIICNFIVGRTRTIEQLMKEDGFDAVYIGVGAGLPRFIHSLEPS